jgi:hypothetical protein
MSEKTNKSGQKGQQNDSKKNVGITEKSKNTKGKSSKEGTKTSKSEKPVKDKPNKGNPSNKTGKPQSTGSKSSSKDLAKTNNTQKDADKTTKNSKKTDPKRNQKKTFRKDINDLTKVRSLELRGNQYLTVLDVDRLYRNLLKEKGISIDSVSNADWKKDMYTMYTCINSWCALFEDVTHENGSFLADYIRLCGVTKVLADAEEERQAFLSLDLPLSSCSFLEKTAFWSSVKIPARGLLSLIYKTQSYKTVKARTRHLSELEERFHELKDVNTLLGYPRRMSLNALVPKMKEEQFEAFLLGNENMKRHNFGREDGFLGRYVYGNSLKGYYANENGLFPTDPEKEISPEQWDDDHAMLPEFLADRISQYIYAIFRHWKQDTSLFTLPPGKTYEGHATYLKKYEQCIQNQQWLREHGVNFPVIPTSEIKDPEDCCRLVAVPKTYKKPRLVAPEATAKQVLGYQVAKGMERCLKRIGCDLRDQNINRNLVKQAFNLGLCTADWTAASDSISLNVVRRCYRSVSNLLDAMEACRSRYVVVNNTKYLNYRFATMGNSITFPLECSLFASVAAVAVELALKDKFPEKYERLCYAIEKYVNKRLGYSLSTGLKKEKWDLWEKEFHFYLCRSILKRYVHIYGDDTIIPTWAFDYLASFAKLMNFKLNVDKSFSEGKAYRESCGAEVLSFDGENTIDIEGSYWPRGLSNIAYAELVSMQHKMAAHHYENASRFLINCILDVYPQVTYSSIGSEYNDVWTSYDSLITRGYSDYGVVLCLVHVWAEPGWIFGRKMPQSKNSWLVYDQPVIPPINKDPDNSEQILSIKRKGQAYTKYSIYIREDLLDTFSRFFGHNLIDWSPWLNFRKTGKIFSYDELEVQYPGDENIEVHTTVISKSSKRKLTEDVLREVDHLAYLMSIGKGIEHVNSSEYTAECNKIFDHIDLAVPRSVLIENHKYSR